MSGRLSTIRDGLAVALRRIDGMRVYEHLTEQANPPMAVITLERVNYHLAFQGGTSEWNFIVVIVVGRMGERSAQELLDDVMGWDGPRSVRAALDVDKSLSGSAQSVKTVAARGVRPFSIGDAQYLGVEFEVTVAA